MRGDDFENNVFYQVQNKKCRAFLNTCDISSTGFLGIKSIPPGWQMAFWTPFFPFGLKWNSLLRCHMMTSVKTFSPQIKNRSSSFMENIYIFIIFYHLITFEPRIFEVWKGKNLCPREIRPVSQNVSVDFTETGSFMQRRS